MSINRFNSNQFGNKITHVAAFLNDEQTLSILTEFGVDLLNSYNDVILPLMTILEI